MAADVRRIIIGLDGHQSLELRVSTDAYEELRKALGEEGRRWHRLPTQDSDVELDLTKVVYVSVSSQEHRVGF
jgi:hypothetical protein